MNSSAALQFARQVCSIAGILLIFGAVVRFAGVTVSWLPGGSMELAAISIAATLAGSAGR